MNKLAPLAALVATLALSASAQAADDAPTASAKTPVHLDVEVDPTAYALSGHSVHLGLGHGRTRLDLGVFAMEVPRFVHGVDGLDARFDGFGFKLHHFVLAEPGEQRGLFVGVDGGITRVRIENTEDGATAKGNQIGLGAHVGYRITLPWNLYATPWIGVNYAFDAKALTASGRTLNAMPWTVFPAIHLGYRFL